MTYKQPWVIIYRPNKREDFIGNQKAVEEINNWIKKWEKKPPKKKAIFIYGPPGTGKTSIIKVLAKENSFSLIEVNASDKRNKANIEETLGRNVKQNITLFGKKRMLLLDEMDGLSGSHDRGGISAILKIIDKTSFPIILISNTLEENMENRFRSILRKAESIEFKPLKTSDICSKLKFITDDQELSISQEVLDSLALNCGGDLRSAIIDLETITSGKDTITSKDLDVIGERNRLDYTHNILHKIFSSNSLSEARLSIAKRMISYDDLYDWIFENLPIAIDDHLERYNAMDKLAKADIFQNRARFNDWRLLKYMFDLMTGGIALSKNKSQGLGYLKQLNKSIFSVSSEPNTISINESKEGIIIKPNKWLGKEKWSKLNNNLKSIGAKYDFNRKIWLLPYYREPQNKWRYISTYHQRRRLNSVIRQIALKCHTSSDKVKTEILPFLRYMIRNDENMFLDISEWLNDIEQPKLQNLRDNSFDKKPKDFKSLENYAKYKTREIKKINDKIVNQKDTDTKNLERWLQEEEKRARWEK